MGLTQGEKLKSVSRPPGKAGPEAITTQKGSWGWQLGSPAQMQAEGAHAGPEFSHLMERRKWAEENVKEIARVGRMAQP